MNDCYRHHYKPERLHTSRFLLSNQRNMLFFLNSRLKYIRTQGCSKCALSAINLFYISVRYLQQFQIGLYMYMGPASRNIKFLIIIFVEHRKSLTNFVLHCIFIIYTTSKINMHVGILINVKQLIISNKNTVSSVRNFY